MSRTLEQELKDLRRKVNLLCEIVLEGKPYKPGLDEYYRAIEACKNGDKVPLNLYLERGGEIPDSGRPYKPYVPRKRVESPRAEPTNGSGTPVMLLPGCDKAAKEQRRVV